jgi:hypothetical protein
VVITPDCFATIQKTINHLRAQNVSNFLEIVIVAPTARELSLDESAMREFLGHQVVEVGAMNSTARARAAGARAASSSVVAFAEDHAYPAPGWAEALIDRHREDWAAVGPAIANANPHSITSWANLLIEYSPWLHPAAAGERDHLPGHNGSYKREVLLAYGDRLEGMLDSESILHWDLRAQGYRLYFEPRAQTFHENFSARAPSMTLRFNGGRLFAAARSRSWSNYRRAFFLFASPLIPPLRCSRIMREMIRPGRPRRLLARVLPALIIGLICDGAGETVGYAFGPGSAMTKLSDMEFHRRRFQIEFKD